MNILEPEVLNEAIRRLEELTVFQRRDSLL